MSLTHPLHLHPLHLHPLHLLLLLHLAIILVSGSTLAMHSSSRGFALRRHDYVPEGNDALYKRPRALGLQEAPPPPPTRKGKEGEGYGRSPHPSGPIFLPPPATHVTIRPGQSASLTCIVKNLGARQVSWIRGRDLHVLTSGEEKFASDSRINATGSGEAWTLTLRYTEPDDGGRYGCQVNTQPPLLSWYNLTVVEVRASIEGGGGRTRYVQVGSTVTLRCVVREKLLIPRLVLWYQGDRLVEKDDQRVKINIQEANHTGDGGQRETTSTLTIARAAPRDSGNYSCWPSAGRADSILLHVIKGETGPAAMQHGNSSTRPSTSLHLAFVLLHLLLLLLLRQRLS